MNDAAHPHVSALTARQAQVLDLIVNSIRTHGFPPSVRELAAQLGLSSPSSVKHQLDALETKGYLKRRPGLPRAMEVTHLSDGSSFTSNSTYSGAAREPQHSHPTPTTNTDVTAPTGTDTTHEKVAAAEPASAQIMSWTVPVGQNDGSDISQIPLVGRIAAGEPITAEQSVDDIFTLPQRFTGQGELFVLEVSGDSMIEAAICDGDYVVVRRQATASNGQIVAAMLDGEATIKVLNERDGHRWLEPRNPLYRPLNGDESTILGKVVTVIRAL